LKTKHETLTSTFGRADNGQLAGRAGGGGKVATTTKSLHQSKAKSLGEIKQKRQKIETFSACNLIFALFLLIPHDDAVVGLRK